MSADPSPSDLFPLVHDFLTSAGLLKTARKLQKEAGLGEPQLPPNSRKLLDIYKLYLKYEPSPKTTPNGPSKKEIKAQSIHASEASDSEPTKPKDVKPPTLSVVDGAESVEKPKKKKKSKVETPNQVAEEEPKKKKRKKEEPQVATQEPTIEPTIEPVPQEQQKKKKKKKDKQAQENKEPEQAVPQGENNEVANETGNKASKKSKKEATPFQRVKPEEAAELAEEMRASQRKPSTEWGEKAGEHLFKVQGKNFRHEKTKKKRGTYRGGKLELGVKSIKFDSD